MAKPPKSPPSSEINGVDEDAARNTDAALEAGEDAANLDLARRESTAKPDHSSIRSKDDRSR
jgi:hypothetical protein